MAGGRLSLSQAEQKRQAERRRHARRGKERLPGQGAEGERDVRPGDDGGGLEGKARAQAEDGGQGSDDQGSDDQAGSPRVKGGVRGRAGPKRKGRRPVASRNPRPLRREES